MGRLLTVILLLSTLFLTACGLARVGPNKNEIYAGAVERGGDAHIIYVNNHVNRTANYTPSYGFGSDFLSAAPVEADTIRPGDTLGLQIWENVDDGLLASLGQSSTTLQQLQVDGDGYIFVPYAGRVLAAGNSPDSLRRIITERLSEQTPDPQVLVTRLAGDGATVTVGGRVTAQGVYPLERPTRNLSAMLARAGGVAIDPEIAVVTVKRGNATGKVWLNDLYANSRNDIALRGGDVILVDEDSRSFTALGALGGQTRVPLGSEEVTAIEAIALVGGLNAATADPTGVFILRDEPESVAQRVLGSTALRGPQRFAYVLDLTRPNGLFLARDFLIRDEDTVYVTEAPFTQFSRVLGAITGTAGSADAITSIGN
ncbi:polysaccharide export protein [Paracoccus sp. S-4012]|uniref:polysaccharide biosynthesis/export family protein n=1 Tax=Paracoccus sp. S-4012 TaxID=2665648 RepID=UPI0012AFFCDE|nr:polysaccharide biosynthesis/export family protein [Paracoccus sp. S-4012]MRX51312.1 polysaccharide export protein [Paracoccus sp. S-4012]